MWPKTLRNSTALPICRSIGSIVEHLTNNLTTKPRIDCSFEFDENGYGCARYEQMIERPPAAAVFAVSDRLLTSNKQKGPILV
jgi:hypothetical protein